MADETQNSTQPANQADKKAAAKGGPKTVQMPRTVHDLITGAKPENKIAAGVIITDELAKKHKLDDDTVAALVDTGAIALVDVLKD